MSNENISFARGIDTVELRGDSPRAVINVLDAVSMARGVTRMSLVNEILSEWASNKLHESTLIQRLKLENPQAAE